MKHILALACAVIVGCGGCPEGQVACGGRCVSLDSDSSCGGCGNACPSSTECRDRRCECAAGQSCGGACVDLDSDERHCGGCHAQCPIGATCTAGVCECAEPTPDMCDGRCVSLALDASHCGACGRACSAGTLCQLGVCRCAEATQSLCGTTCVDLATDLDHCGACGRACDTECAAGICLGVRTLHVGTTHRCVVLDDDRVACWGSNLGGRLSPSVSGISITRPIVIAEAEIDPASTLSLGHAHTCSLSGGAVRCWGDNQDGEVDPSDPGGTRLGPMTVGGIPPAVELLAGEFFTCVLDELGNPMCWGDRQWFSDSGAGAYGPVAWGVATELVALAGLGRPCGTTSAGVVRCDTFSGASPSAYPWPVVQWHGASAVAASQRHGCAVLPDGRVHCRGSNGHGQVGSGGTNDQSAFITSDVPLPMPAIDVQVGNNYSCALLEDRRVYCWGLSDWGQCGTFAMRVLEPRHVDGADGAMALRCGGSSCCVWRGGMDVRCWGYNGSGQLGDRSTDNSAAPVAVDFENLR